MPRTVFVPEAGRAMSFPDGTTDDQIIDYVLEKYAPKPPPAPPEEAVGALESGFYSSLGNLEAAGGKAAQAVGLEGLSKYLLDESRESQEYASKYKPEVADISQISGVGDVASFAGSTIAQSLPETAVGVGGAYAGAVTGGAIGAAIGTPFFGVGAVPAGAVGSVIGGIVGGAMASLPFFVGSNLQRQAEERGVPLEETDLVAASTGAIVQAPLDAAFEFLVARKLPGAGAALDVVKKGFLKEVASTAGKAAITEGLTEPAQQAIELAQANPDKLLEFGPDVQREILNAAAAGALAGGGIGGVAGGIGAFGGPSETSEQKLARTELAGEMAAGRKRSEDLKRFGEINSGVDALAAQPVVGRLKLRKVGIEPTKDNKLKSAIERYQIVTSKGGMVAEFSDPANATAAVDRYKKLSKKNIILEELDTGKEIPTSAITPKFKAPTVATPTVSSPEIATTEEAPSTLSPVQVPGEQPVGFYKTAKGSEYQVFPDGTTVRNKASRKDPGHEGDSGLKPRTFKTIYIDPDSVPGGAAVLSAAGISNLGPQGARVSLKDGKANLVTWNQKENRWGVAPLEGNIPYSLSPQKGLQPLELWNPQNDVPGYESYSNMHAGNEIVEISGPSPEKPTIEPISVSPIGATEAITEAVPEASDAVVEPVEVKPEELADVVAVDEAEQAVVRQQLEERNAKVAEAAKSSLARFGLKDVDTKFVPAFMNGLRIAATRGTETRIQGKSLITIATGIYDPELTTEDLVSKVVSVMDHEAIHSLTTLGLLRDNEMSMLLNVAATTKVPGKAFTYLDVAKSIYEPLARTNPVYRNPEAIREEAVAEMFRDWREKKLGPPSNVRGLINRVFDALRGMFNSMRRENYETVFKRIESGEVGARPRGSKAQKKNTRNTSELDVRVSVEPELRDLGLSPRYPYEQRVPEINAAQINSTVQNLEYGAVVSLLERVTNSRTIRTIVPERYLPSRDRFISLVQNFADKMLPLGLMVDYIRQNGGTVTDSLDAFMQEDLMRSKVGNMLNDREDGLYGGLIRYIRDSGLSSQDFEYYLYARHAKERNQRIREINPSEDPSVGSGMSDEEADFIIDAVDNSPQRSAFLEAELLFREIIKDTNNLRVEAGLTPDFASMVIEDENGNLVETPQYEFYAPLRGFADEASIEGEIEEELRARIGQGFKIRGREDMRAFGRRSKASDIIAHAILQNSEAVIRAEKNKVGLSLLGLVEGNPELAADYGVEVMTRGKKPLKKYVTSKGVVKTMVDPMYKNRDDVMVVKREGQEIPIRIDNRFLQKALTSKNTGSPDIAQKALNFLQRGNRFLASVNTGLNPEFMLVNFPRDLQTALINISQYEIDGIKMKIMKDSVRAIKGVHAILRNPEAENDWSEWYRMFRQDGGNTNGFYGAFTIEDRISRIGDLVNEKDGSSVNKIKKAANTVIDILENANNAFENSIRLSVYKNTIEAGVSRQRAAQIAKNLTVNFDKRGEYGPVLNSLYLFYNASIQGSLSMAMAFGRSAKVRKAFAGLIVVGMMQDVINSLMSEEDEDGKKIYDKIPDYKLESNMIIMDPFGLTDQGYFAIPLPYGFNALYNMGRAISRSQRGEYKTSEAITSIGSTFIDAFNPVGGTESFLNFIAPTALDPIVALSINQDFTGRRIYPEPFPGSVPKADSQQYWSTTSPIFKNTADFLNTATGGTEYVPGALDFNPAIMQYMYDYITGGLGGFVRRTYDTATETIPAAFAGDLANVEINNIPVFRKLYGNVSERVTFEDYFDNVNHVLARGEELKSAIKEGDPQRIKNVRSRFADELKIYPAIKTLANRRNRLASELRKIRENDKLPPEVKRRRQDVLQKQIEVITDRVNKLYEDNIENKYPGLFS
jgi:hypothetical protein